MLTEIWYVIKSFFTVLVNLITGTTSLVLSLSRVSVVVGVVAGLLPPIIGGCIMATIAILIIKFVLGR